MLKISNVITRFGTIAITVLSNIIYARSRFRYFLTSILKGLVMMGICSFNYIYLWIKYQKNVIFLGFQ